MEFRQLILLGTHLNSLKDALSFGRYLLGFISENPQ